MGPSLAPEVRPAGTEEERLGNLHQFQHQNPPEKVDEVVDGGGKNVQAIDFGPFSGHEVPVEIETVEVMETEV